MGTYNTYNNIDINLGILNAFLLYNHFKLLKRRVGQLISILTLGFLGYSDCTRIPRGGVNQTPPPPISKVIMQYALVWYECVAIHVLF